MYYKDITIGSEYQTSKLYAIYDTESDMFVTSIWSEKWCHKILKLWKGHHPELNMARFELRVRLYPEDNGYDNTAVLVVDKSNNTVVAFYHWANKNYTSAYDHDKYKFIKYTPPMGVEVNDIYKRYDMQKWDGKGKILEVIRGHIEDYE